MNESECVRCPNYLAMILFFLGLMLVVDISKFVCFTRCGCVIAACIACYVFCVPFDICGSLLSFVLFCV